MSGREGFLGLLHTPEWRYSDAALEVLAQEGIDAWRANRVDGVRFELFNQHEADVVKMYIMKHAPDFPFQITRVA